MQWWKRGGRYGLVMATILCVWFGITFTTSADVTQTSSQVNSTLGVNSLSTSSAVDSTASMAGPDTTSQLNSSGTSMTEQAHDSVQQLAEQQLDDTIQTKDLDSFWQSLQQQYGGYLPDASGQSLVKSIMTSGGFSVQGMVRGLLRYFLSEILNNAQLLGGILLLSVLAAVLETLQSAFERQTVSQVAYTMIFLVLMVLAIGSFTEAIGAAKHAIQSMTNFMLATVPIVVALLAASGALASAAFFQPLLVFAVHMISNVVFLLVFPLIFFSAILEIVSTLSPRYKLTRLAGLLRTGGTVVLGVCLSTFIGISSVQGLGKGIMDGVALRTTKFAVKSIVPVVGGAISDAAETVVSASLLVKNAVGIAGLVIIAVMALFPALKVLALSFIYSGSSALMQPLGDNPLIGCLGALSKSLILVFASIAAVALMFFVAICILLASANLAVVMA